MIFEPLYLQEFHFSKGNLLEKCFGGFHVVHEWQEYLEGFGLTEEDHGALDLGPVGEDLSGRF